MGVRCAIAAIAAAPLDDLEEEALSEAGTVELEILALLIAIIKRVGVFQPFDEGRIQIEPGLEIIVVIGRDFQRLKAVGSQGLGCCEDVARFKGQMLDRGAEPLGDEVTGQGAAVFRTIERYPQRPFLVFDHLAAHQV